MPPTTSPPLSVRVRGPLACFTRPELKVERVSYAVPTPSAARGMVEAILWKPAIRWVIDRIHVLAPIRWVAFRRNEVSNKIPKPATVTLKGGGDAPLFFADDDRQQRNTVALRDVDYRIDIHFEMTPRAGAEDNVNKFVEMFSRRIKKGQHHHQPYFGCREFPAEVLLVDDAPPPIPDNRDLGLMLWDIAYGKQSQPGCLAKGEANRPVFFEAALRDGVLHVPTDPENALARGGAA